MIFLKDPQCCSSLNTFDFQLELPATRTPDFTTICELRFNQRQILGLPNLGACNFKAGSFKEIKHFVCLCNHF